MTAPIIVTQRKEIRLVQKPGIGPPGEINGGFSVDGVAPFNLVSSISGTLSVAAGIHRLYMPRPGRVGQVDVSLGVAPVGADAIFDVNLNGSTIFTTQTNRPTVPDGQNLSLANVPDIVDFATGDYFTWDCDQRGVTAWGGAATLTIWYF